MKKIKEIYSCDNCQKEFGNMKIDPSQVKAIFEFTPAEYILCYDKDRSEWALFNLIDRSEKGKSPDIGMPVLYVSDEEQEKLTKAGFSYYEI